MFFLAVGREKDCQNAKRTAFGEECLIRGENHIEGRQVSLSLCFVQDAAEDTGGRVAFHGFEVSHFPTQAGRYEGRNRQSAPRPQKNEGNHTETIAHCPQMGGGI